MEPQDQLTVHNVNLLISTEQKKTEAIPAKVEEVVVEEVHHG
jgi:hypothetical protein